MSKTLASRLRGALLQLHFFNAAVHHDGFTGHFLARSSSSAVSREAIEGIESGPEESKFTVIQLHFACFTFYGAAGLAENALGMLLQVSTAINNRNI